jgi:uncharacterized integral membrane protein
MNFIDAICNYILHIAKITAGILAVILVALFVASPKTFKLSTLRDSFEAWILISIGTAVFGALIAVVFLSIGKLAGP